MKEDLEERKLRTSQRGGGGGGVKWQLIQRNEVGLESWKSHSEDVWAAEGKVPCLACRSVRLTEQRMKTLQSGQIAAPHGVGLKWQLWCCQTRQVWSIQGCPISILYFWSRSCLLNTDLLEKCSVTDLVSIHMWQSVTSKQLLFRADYKATTGQTWSLGRVLINNDLPLVTHI